MKKLLILLLALCLCGCSAVQEQPGETPSSPSIQVEEFDDIFSDEDLNAEVEPGEAVEAEPAPDGTVTVTEGGTYRFDSSHSGQIIVEAGKKDEVRLVLEGANITCQSSAAIYIKSADKVYITLAEGTENTVSTTGAFVQTDDNTVDGAIFSKTDLTVNGAGALTVTCAQGHGIVCKDDLKIASGSFTVEAAGQGITGKDSLSIADGSFRITAGTDGLHSKNDEDATLGNLYIAGGSFQITAGADGLDASNALTVLGGDITVKTGGGSAAGTQQSGSWGGRATASDTSYKGLKAGKTLLISGGQLNVDAQEDALHCNDTVQISGGTLTLAAGDDGIHADTLLDISAGAITVTKSYEGLESATILITGGQMDITASDDGLNAAGGSDGSGSGGAWGGDMFADDGSGITIAGGTLLVDAGGDGVDSNGTLTVTGGTVYVDGPTNSGNGALDCNGTAAISGGTVIAVGASGMAENFDSSSTQGSILYTLSASQSSGTKVQLTDENGTVLASHTARKSFNSVVISAPGLEQGKTYTLTVGSQSFEIVMDGTVYSNGGGFGGGGFGTGGGGFGGNRPGGGFRP